MREGFVGRGLGAGLVGGFALAIWIFAIDTVQGVPFRTPGLLAGGLLGTDIGNAGFLGVAAYTVVHFLALGAVGVGSAWLMSKLPISGSAVMGLVLGFLLFDLVFYGSVIVTGVDVVNELGWPGLLAGNLIAGLVIMRILHSADESSAKNWLHALDEHETTREGLIAGVIGATLVAAWFFGFDLMMERLLFTPGALGSALFFGATSVEQVQVNATTVLGYTAVHFAAFAVAGLLSALVLRRADDNQPLLLGGLMLFVAFEALFLGVMAIVSEFLLGPLAWWSVAGGNLIATVGMGAYLWRRHPQLLRDLDAEHLLADDEPEPRPAEAA